VIGCQVLCRYLVTSDRASGVVQIYGDVIGCQVLCRYMVASDRVSGIVQICGDK